MTFYSTSTVVNEFVYEGTEIEIHKASKGAVHCDIPHELNITKCYGCGKAISTTVVYFIVINDSIVDGIECSSEQEAREFAVDYVSHLIDGRDRGEKVDDDVTIDVDDDEKADTLPPPPLTKTRVHNGADWGMDDPPADRPVSPALRAMRQLNWPAMITSIFDRLGIK